MPLAKQGKPGIREPGEPQIPFPFRLEGRIYFPVHRIPQRPLFILPPERLDFRIGAFQIQAEMAPLQPCLQFKSVYMPFLVIEVGCPVGSCPVQVEHPVRMAPEVGQRSIGVGMEEFPVPQRTEIELGPVLRLGELGSGPPLVGGNRQDACPVPSNFIHIEEAEIGSPCHAQGKIVIHLFFERQLPGAFPVLLPVPRRDPVEPPPCRIGESFPVAVAHDD